ncbi:MAG TPA: PIN domain-containing protein [Methylomirabilota bacterium]|nr:PIN domain-containing protein [Methylomirabilota bacterium]
MIFVDTGAWFALAVRNDPDHASAMRWLRQNHEPLITTDYVLAETATLIRMRDKTVRGHRLAVRVASSILRQQAAILQNVTATDLQTALQIFQRYSDHSFSFIDCTSFSIMERLGVTYAFAFDSHFDQYPGLIKVPQ